MYRKATFILAFALLLCACGGPKTEVTIVFTDFQYAPSTITVPVGQPITFTLKNEGAVEHDFVVEDIDVTDVHVQDESTGGHHMEGMTDYDLHVATPAGGSNVLQFTALEPGTYRIF